MVVEYDPRECTPTQPMTIEQALERYKWVLIQGDAWTPQSAWHYTYLQYKPLNEVKPRKVNRAQDAARITQLLKKAGLYVSS